MTIKIAGIVPESFVDGSGIRYTVFVQGCPHHCPGCHNPQTHDFGAGREVDTDDLLVEALRDPLVSGLTFSGGEPFCQPEPLSEMARLAHGFGLTVWAWSGYTYDEILADPAKRELLEAMDVLIDGRYIAAERDLELKYRGSRNQRVIDVRQSLAAGRIVEVTT